MALIRAIQGRLRPSFFLLWGLCAAAQSQQPVYRCGQAYTNVPADPAQCERLAPQAVTMVPGTRVQTLPAPGAASAAPVAPASAPSVSQRERDAMARSVLQTELEQARQRHARLQQDYREAERARAGEEAPSAQRQHERVAQLQSAVARAERDIQSLEREIARLPAPVLAP